MILTPEQITALLKELMERVEHPLPHMQPFQVELKDGLAREVRTRGAGLTRKVTFDLDADLYRHLQDTIPEKAVLRGILWLEDVEVEPLPAPVKKKTKKKDGPHGKFWEEMFLEGIIGRTDFKGFFGIPEGLTDWNEIVRNKFGRESLTEISPDDICDWFWNLSAMEIPQDLILKIRKIAKTLEPEFPAGQFFSPFDLGARKAVKIETIGQAAAEIIEDTFMADNQMP